MRAPQFFTQSKIDAFGVSAWRLGSCPPPPAANPGSDHIHSHCCVSVYWLSKWRKSSRVKIADVFSYRFSRVGSVPKWTQVRWSVWGSRRCIASLFHVFSQHAAKLALQALYMLRQIRPSVTLRYCVKTRECRGMRSLLSASPVSLVFWCQAWLMGDAINYTYRTVSTFWQMTPFS